MKYFLYIFSILSAFAITLCSAESVPQNKNSLIRETFTGITVSCVIPAKETYVLLLAESSAMTFSEAERNVQSKIRNFLSLVRDKFPKAQCQIFPVRLAFSGDSYTPQESRKPFSAKILFFTLPISEKTALPLLDEVLKYGFFPFAGESSSDICGAVFYGVSDPNICEKTLYQKGVNTLIQRAREHGKFLNMELFKTLKIDTHIPKRTILTLRNRAYSVALPVRFCSASKNIPLTLDMSGVFLYRKK